MASFKFGLIFSVLLMAATIDVMWFSMMQVAAVRNVDPTLGGLKRRLLPQLNDIFTCGRPCISDEACRTDCILCCSCTMSIGILLFTGVAELLFVCYNIGFC
ncbi:hypothetical protein P3S68_016064 [Capsicum galapagoense]